MTTTRRQLEVRSNDTTLRLKDTAGVIQEGLDLFARYSHTLRHRGICPGLAQPARGGLFDGVAERGEERVHRRRAGRGWPGCQPRRERMACALSGDTFLETTPGIFDVSIKEEARGELVCARGDAWIVLEGEAPG
jgi:hypothetical protein